MKKLMVLVAALFAVCSLSAQDLKTVFNEGGAAYTAKNFQVAVEKFEQVVAEGMDMPDMESTVASAKTYIPKCYYMLGGRAAQAKNLDVALENFIKSADKAEL